MVKMLEADKLVVEEDAKLNVENKRKKEITIKVTPKELEQLQVQALEEGKSVEMLAGSIVHKYLDGRLS